MGASQLQRSPLSKSGLKAGWQCSQQSPAIHSCPGICPALDFQQETEMKQPQKGPSGTSLCLRSPRDRFRAQRPQWQNSFRDKSLGMKPTDKTRWWSLGTLSPCQGTSACGWDCCLHGPTPGWSPVGFSDRGEGEPGTLSRGCHRAPRWPWKLGPPDSVKIEAGVCEALAALQVLHGVLTRAL